ncbi:MAG: efflux RND transporter periplasmic adaptor subunit [Bacteroidota bacterium]|nr:efflux RND transporter periplasmic adaptor subunit [Bacteroidota bacterium]
MKNLLIIFSVTFLITSCKNNKPVEEIKKAETGNVITLTGAQMNNAHIETGSVEQKQIASLLKVNGRIDVPPQNMVSVSVPLGGYLKSTKLLPGLHVSRNEVIAVVEDNQYIQLQQDYLTAKVQLSLNESEYNRQKDLNASKAISDKVFQQAQSAYETQKILIKSLEEKLKLVRINPNNLSVNNISKSINVYSPIDGFVTKVNVNIGKYVTSGDVLFELVNPSDIHLNLKVFEKDLDKISIGQPLVSYTNNNPEKKYPGDIILISKDVSPDGIIDVHCHFDNYDKNLFPGMYMNAEIELKNKMHNVLPDEAFVRFEGKEYFFENTGKNKFEMNGVEIGKSENGFTEIISEKDLSRKAIVTKGAYTLLMSLKNTEEE